MLATILTLHVALLKHPVTFTYTSSNAKAVQIAGDFNAWNSPFPMEQKGDKWSRSFDLPDNGRIEYKFVVDGNWILDPANPNRIENGLGGGNSFWQGPKYQFSVPDGDPKTPLNRSEINVGGRNIIVFAPTNSAGLPIIVYGDGPNYEKPGKVQNVIANLVESHKIRPIIIALVPPIDRMKEYGLEWKSYGDYIFNQVLPAVREATHASDKAQDVFMGGSSMGGLISIRLAEEFPDKMAGGIEAQSAAIQWSPLSINHEDVSTPEKLRQISPTTRIWLDWGEFEDKLTTSNVALVKTLKAMRRRFGTRTTPEGHNWTAWRNRMEAGLTYLLGRGRD